MRNFIVFDCEGVPSGKKNKTRNPGETALIYDAGFIVANRDGDVLETFSYVNTDFIGKRLLMGSAYYADKLVNYKAGARTREPWEMADTLTIYNTLLDAISEYGVTDLWAYNCAYDMAALENTIRTASNGFITNPLPDGVQWRDIWSYAGSTLCNTRKYALWCIENNLVTASGNPSTSADTVGKYLRGSMDYVEQHHGLDDATDELHILLAAMRRKQKARLEIGQGWRHAAKIAKEL